MTEAAGEAYAGLPVLEAREKVVADLQAQGLIVRREPYTHTVPFSSALGRAHRAADLPAVVHEDGRARRAGDRGRARRARCGSPPSAGRASTSTGWRTSGPGASPASCGGATSSRSGTAATRPTWAPSRRAATAGSATPTCSTRGSRSGLWPFVTLGWPQDTPELRAFYPTTVLSTGRDILFLWVARMVMLGLHFAGDVPFRDVYIHSIIQAPDGRRMSKSLGTGIDPIDLIEGGRGRRSSRRAATSRPTAPTRCASACSR